MDKFRYHIGIHILSILLYTLLSVFIVENLSERHPLLAFLYLAVTLFSLYYLILMRYLNLKKVMDKTLITLHAEMDDIAILEKIMPAYIPTKTFPLSQWFHQTSIKFDTDIQIALDYIKQSHIAILDLNRLNDCKSNTLDTILAVSHHILSRDTNEDFYELILTSAIDVIERATKGSILLLNSETNRYEYRAAVGFDLEYLKKIDYSLEQTFLYQNSNDYRNHPLVVSSVQDFSRSLLSDETLEWLNKAKWLEAKEVLSSPILIDDKLYAILNIDSSEEHAFDDVDVQLIQFFSSQISIAIRNRILVDETIKLSKFDKLTGAYNRNYFEKIFDSHNELSLENLEPYAIVLCDLNFLKSINDTFGHTAGDIVLSEFSSIIQASIRDSDIFSRVGGDEFVLLLKNIRLARAQEKMTQIFKQYEYHAVNFNGHRLPVSFSYGIAASPDDSMVYDVLVKVADSRMYQFKKHYKETHQDILTSILQ